MTELAQGVSKYCAEYTCQDVQPQSCWWLILISTNKTVVQNCVQNTKCKITVSSLQSCNQLYIVLFVQGRIAAYLVSTVSAEPLFSHLLGSPLGKRKTCTHTVCTLVGDGKPHLQGVWLAKLVNDSGVKTMVLYGTRAGEVYFYACRSLSSSHLEAFCYPKTVSEAISELKKIYWGIPLDSSSYCMLIHALVA